jgi:hypothetical protein
VKKWGVAFAIFTLSYTLSTNMENVIYLESESTPFRVIINIPIIIYLFRRIFSKTLGFSEGRFV